MPTYPSRTKERRQQYYQKNKEKILQKQRQYTAKTRDKQREYKKQYETRHPLAILLRNCRARAKKEGLPCNLTLQYLESLPIPTVCPVLGISISSDIHEHKPSLDKIIPSLGYVQGNVQFISLRANRLKSDASIEEIEKIYNYIKSHSYVVSHD